MHRHLHRPARSLRGDRERDHRQPAAVLLATTAPRGGGRRRRLIPVAAAAVAALLAGCGWLIGTPAPQGSDALVSVAVTGAVPDEELSLEIGGAAWSVAGSGGVASLSSGVPPTIRLVRVEDCAVLAELDADPGSRHVITFAAEGTATIEEWTDAIDAGPALARRDAPLACG